MHVNFFVCNLLLPISVVAEPPHSLRAQSFSHNTMMIYWKPPDNVNSIQNVSGYYIFYRELDGPLGSWYAAGVPNLTMDSFLLRDLKAYTTYRIRMTLAVKTGNGPGSEEVVNKTIEGGTRFLFYKKAGFAQHCNFPNSFTTPVSKRSLTLS